MRGRMALEISNIIDRTDGSIKSLSEDPFELRPRKDPDALREVHQMGRNIICDTEDVGYETPGGAALLEIVLDASEGFIPLWAPDVTLRWRFRESSFAGLQNSPALKAKIEQLLGEAMLAWGDAAPIKLANRDDAWDFEIVMQPGDKCNPNGCVLASAFFPDAGRHQVFIYPKMFTQVRQEQVETLIHETGHVFGLRHFFAKISETAWASEIFGEHSKFSIMNYGADSRLTDADKSDLKRLYGLVWSCALREINGTPIRLVRPYHESGLVPGGLLIAATGSGASTA
eukprot:TRINITY_DN67273_c0_g1_i1.p1 TRINITY_DN67273_c0_g1~~TRINITY_DN67273_c0_g1_i1.p1  ORF type:complete len:286 (-),score=14.82 TRINITY_DN67273_c0_g1_i1:324-1181(-)